MFGERQLFLSGPVDTGQRDRQWTEERVGVREGGEARQVPVPRGQIRVQGDHVS